MTVGGSLTSGTSILPLPPKLVWSVLIGSLGLEASATPYVVSGLVFSVLNSKFPCPSVVVFAKIVLAARCPRERFKIGTTRTIRVFAIGVSIPDSKTSFCEIKGS